MNSTSYTPTSMLSLVILIVICATALWLLKRNRRFQSPQSTPMVLRGQMAVGPRERVVLIEVAGQLVMVGVAPGAVRSIAQFPVPVVGDPSDPAQALIDADIEATQGNDFRRLLDQFKARRHPDQNASKP